MTTKREKEQQEIEKLKDYFRKFTNERLISLINARGVGGVYLANKKAFKAVLKERGIDRNDI